MSSAPSLQVYSEKSYRQYFIDVLYNSNDPKWDLSWGLWSLKYKIEAICTSQRPFDSSCLSTKETKQSRCVQRKINASELHTVQQSCSFRGRTRQINIKFKHLGHKIFEMVIRVNVLRLQTLSTFYLKVQCQIFNH